MDRAVHLPYIEQEEIAERNAQDTLNDFAMVLDHQGRVISFSKACEQIIRQPLDKIQHRPVWEILNAHPPADPAETVFCIPAQDGQPFRLKESWITKHEKDRFISWSNHTVLNNKGSVEYIISTGKDNPRRREKSHLDNADECIRIFDSISDAVTIHDNDYNIVEANQAARALLDLPTRIKPGTKCYEYYHGTGFPPAGCVSCQALKSGETVICEMFEPKLGRHIEIKALPRLGHNQEVIGTIHIVRDIDARKKSENEQKKLEAQLIQSQKMECVGRLAGGVAHDFNNILTGILGYCEISLMDLCDDHPLKNNLQIIYNSAERAAGLTKQLLAFSRKQIMEMKEVNLNQVVNDMMKMLQRLLGEDVTLDLTTCSTAKTIKADYGQLEQILMNLAVNARDAMPDGGHLTIKISNADLDWKQLINRQGMIPGSYVVLTVTDTGIGMENDSKEKIFEPFYTTKELGKGTGLGLATVYGIVKQHKAFIFVDSEPRRGTTFRIYFPASKDQGKVEEKEKNQELSDVPHGTETILVAEDEYNIRKLIVEILSALDYKVLDAPNGKEALAISSSYQEDIHLLLTDVIMPDINGRKLADALVLQRPDTKIVYMSGYTADVIAKHGVLEPGMRFIQKPLTPVELANKIRKALDQKNR